MKTEYLVEIYDAANNSDFFIIVTLKNKKTFFIGNFKMNEKEIIKKEIFNIFTFKECPRFENLKRIKPPVSTLFSYRNTYADSIRNSYSYKKTEKLIFIK